MSGCRRNTSGSRLSKSRIAATGGTPDYSVSNPNCMGAFAGPADGNGGNGGNGGAGGAGGDGGAAGAGGEGGEGGTTPPGDDWTQGWTAFPVN